jgi:ribosomal protein S10
VSELTPIASDTIVPTRAPKRPAPRRPTPRKAKRPQSAGKRRGVWLENELYEQLVRLAKAEERTVSYLMRRFIKRGVQAALEKPN